MDNLKIIMIGLVGIALFVVITLIPTSVEAHHHDGEYISFCNVKDCYEIKTKDINEKINECLFKSELHMLVAHWKELNRWKQIIYVKNRKIVNCIPEFPRMIIWGRDLNTEQLAFLEKLKCSIHDLKIDPVLAGIHYYNRCMDMFKPENYLKVF